MSDPPYLNIYPDNKFSLSGSGFGESTRWDWQYVFRCGILGSVGCWKRIKVDGLIWFNYSFEDKGVICEGLGSSGIYSMFKS